MRRNRFIAICNRTRSQTWRIEDRATQTVVMDHLSPDSALEWVRGMNAQQRAGLPIDTWSGKLPALPAERWAVS
jgi:alkylated DNA nucleotide flippase Atl1